MSIFSSHENTGMLSRSRVTGSARIGRVEDKTLRARYLCKAIFGQPGVFESELLYHMLMVCPHVSMFTARERLKTGVENLCQVEAGPIFPKPASEFGVSEIWAVMMLCTSAASLSPQPPQDA